MMMSINKYLGVRLPEITIELKWAGSDCYNYVNTSLGKV